MRMREGNCVQVSNPHLSTIDEDFLVSFKIRTHQPPVANLSGPGFVLGPEPGIEDRHLRSETHERLIKNFETKKVSFWASFKALQP